MPHSRPSIPTAGETFRVRELGVGFRSRAGVTQVVAGLSLAAQPGRIVGVAGESGSGKTTAVLASIGYLPSGAVRVAGEAMLGATPLYEMGPEARRRVWATRISYVGQDAASALNPAFHIGSQLREVLQVNGGLAERPATRKAAELLAAVRLPDPAEMMRRYPFQCSGGQLQRVAIALAIACDPQLIILDEPTTGLDVTTQAEVVSMLIELIRARSMAALYISHDLALLGNVADTLVILYAGEVVEQGPTADVLLVPRHPYTRALLDALPSTREAVRPVGLPGLPPGHVVADACPFAPRCPWVVDVCHGCHPALERVDTAEREVRCLRAAELGPLAASARTHFRTSPEPAPTPAVPTLSLENVSCSYGSGPARVQAVLDATLTVGPGEVVALVGESGSGKSTLGRAVVGLVPVDSGVVRLEGARLESSGRRTREQYNAVQIVFQNPDSSLNPRHTVAGLIGRSVTLFRPEVGRAQRSNVVDRVLQEVRLDPALGGRYPHELSGGQKQRVAIARAFVARPRLVICDEIVSGQDVSVQATILELVRSMQERYGTALLFISHDLAVVRSIAQRVYVIQRGCIVESGPTDQVFDRPEAAYSRRLLSAVMISILAAAASETWGSGTTAPPPQNGADQ